MIFDDKKYVAEKIKEYRKKSGMTQAELAEKIDLGTKQISRIEVGDFYPSLSTFFKIAEILKMDLNDFVDTGSEINLRDKNSVKSRLLNMIYTASEEELKFYDRLLIFAKDEVAEVKKNLLMNKLK